MLILEKKVTGQGHSDPKMRRDTPPSQDAFTHQIWLPQKHKKYAPDMIILKTRLEVKFKVTVTHK